MSYTSILGVVEGGEPEVLAELSNAWGSAPLVWDAIGVKYCGFERYQAISHMEEINTVMTNPAASVIDRTLFALTCEQVYLARENYKRLAGDIREWIAANPPPERSVNHWPAIADLLDTQPDYERIVFHWTSVDDSPLHGEWNEETETYAPVSLDDWSEVYDHMD